MNFFISSGLAILVFTLTAAEWDTSIVTGYHFHTYFFQNNEQSLAEAVRLRDQIQTLSETQLAGCRLNRLNLQPVGPHVIGSYETCCNASAVNAAQSFFIQNHGNLSILLHALTRYEILDHTTRAMWLGKDMKLDISALREELAEVPQCLPIEF